MLSTTAACYLHSDDTLTLDMAPPAIAIGREFDVEAIRTAIRGAQQGEVMYPEFKRLSMEAGCIGYTVWIDGRQVTYFGRKGEMHVEPIPL